VSSIAAHRIAQLDRSSRQSHSAQCLVERHAFELSRGKTDLVVSRQDEVDAGSDTPLLLAHLWQAREAVGELIQRRAEDDLRAVALPGREPMSDNDWVDDRPRLVREVQNRHAVIVRQ
jgi:hypothetical protein